jgi:dTDP-4-dehydrorhamnose reductase
MKLLITDAGGQPGRALYAAAPSGFAVTALDRQKLDIAALEAIRAATCLRCAG